MAEHPDEYGLLLINVHEQNNQAIHLCVRGPIRDKGIHCIEHSMCCMRFFNSGTIQNHILLWDGQSFISQIKSSKITRYHLILNKLIEFGFVINGYSNNKIKDATFTVSYPSNPQMIDTLKVYCDCREINEDQEKFIGDIHQFKLNFYTLDYKYLADLSQLPEVIWVTDKIINWDKEAQDFYIAFYEYMKSKKCQDCDIFKKYKNKLDDALIL